MSNASNMLVRPTLGECMLQQIPAPISQFDIAATKYHLLPIVNMAMYIFISQRRGQ